VVWKNNAAQWRGAVHGSMCAREVYQGIILRVHAIYNATSNKDKSVCIVPEHQAKQAGGYLKNMYLGSENDDK
jgi:hypothetical protein